MATSSPSRSAPTLADAIAATAANQVLTPRQRDDRLSALRTAARVIGRAPADIPADPRPLARRLTTVSPALNGLSRGRWNNIRSLVGKAVAEVAPVSPGRLCIPLTPAWEVLRAGLNSRREAYGLSRFMRFCGRAGIAPEQVNASTFARFDEHLEQSLAAQPDLVGRQTRQIWNGVAQRLLGPNAPVLPIPPRKFSYTLPWSAFPRSLEKDINAWLERLAGHDLLADLPFRPVRPSTLMTRAFQLRSFASALVHRGVPREQLRSIADLVTIERLKEGFRFYLERRGGRPTSGMAATFGALKAAARHWVRVSDEHFAQIKTLQNRLAVKQGGLTKKNRARLRPFDDQALLSDLLRLPHTLMQRADRAPADRRAAYQAQTAIAIEILLMTGIRIGNLACIDRETHLSRLGRNRATVHLSFGAGEVKNRQELEFPLPPETTALLARYLAAYLPLLAPPGSTALFPGLRAPCKSAQALGKQISGAIRRMLGVQVNPHLFRHLGAKAFLTANPGFYEVVRRVLGHRSIDTTTNYYNGLETAAAVRQFDAVIQRLRGGAPS